MWRPAAGTRPATGCEQSVSPWWNRDLPFGDSTGWAPSCSSGDVLRTACRVAAGRATRGPGAGSCRIHTRTTLGKPRPGRPGPVGDSRVCRSAGTLCLPPETGPFAQNLPSSECAHGRLPNRLAGCRSDGNPETSAELGWVRWAGRGTRFGADRARQRGAAPAHFYSISSSTFGMPTRPSTAEAGSRSNGSGKPRLSRLARVIACGPKRRRTASVASTTRRCF